MVTNGPHLRSRACLSIVYQGCLEAACIHAEDRKANLRKRGTSKASTPGAAGTDSKSARPSCPNELSLHSWPEGHPCGPLLSPSYVEQVFLTPAQDNSHRFHHDICSVTCFSSSARHMYLRTVHPRRLHAWVHPSQCNFFWASAAAVRHGAATSGGAPGAAESAEMKRSGSGEEGEKKESKAPRKRRERIVTPYTKLVNRVRGLISRIRCQNNFKAVQNSL